MKYPRGTVLKWTAKALDPKREGAAQRKSSDRMIVISHDEVMFVREREVIQMDMYKTQDSYVEPSGEKRIKWMSVDADEVKRVNGYSLVHEFNLLQVVKA